MIQPTHGKHLALVADADLAPPTESPIERVRRLEAALAATGQIVADDVLESIRATATKCHSASQVTVIPAPIRDALLRLAADTEERARSIHTLLSRAGMTQLAATH